jgi:DNA repair protein RadC
MESLLPGAAGGGVCVTPTQLHHASSQESFQSSPELYQSARAPVRSCSEHCQLSRAPVRSSPGLCRPSSEPFQLTFLSPLASSMVEPVENAYEDEGDSNGIAHSRRGQQQQQQQQQRRRRCRSLTCQDVELADRSTEQTTHDRDARASDACANPSRTSDPRALLRKPTGEFLPPLYSRPLAIDPSGDVRNIGDAFHPADADTIIASAEALLAHRLRPGVKIFRDTNLLLRFLRIRLVSQRQPVFAALYLDRKQRLIRFSEITRGENDHVIVRPKELVRDLLACGGEQVLCVRSDPRGDHHPTSQDVEDARRVKRALDVLMVPLLDYIVVGQAVGSLRMRGHL